MKLLVVLVLLLSGLGWGYGRTRDAASDVSLHHHSERTLLPDRSGSRADRGSISANPARTTEGRSRAGGSLPEPVLLMLFGGLMFLMSWVCVAWASWRERHVAPVWQSAASEALADAG